MSFAEDVMWISMGSILSTFDIGPAVDETGQALPIEYKQIPSILTYV